MIKPRIFVGSSVDGLPIAHAIQENLEHDAEVVVWDQDVFPLASYNLDALSDELQRSDFGVFVFKPEDYTKIHGEEHRTVRDNVLFELGLFMGRLGKDRSFIVQPRGAEKLHLPTDLSGINLAKITILATLMGTSVLPWDQRATKFETRYTLHAMRCRCLGLPLAARWILLWDNNSTRIQISAASALVLSLE